MKGYRLFITVSAAIIITAGIVGIWIAGSPAEQRARRLDQERANRMDQITYQIDEFYRMEKRLPSNLTDLKGKVSWWNEMSILDPESAAPFEYVTLSEKRYQICAVFLRTSDKNTGYRYPTAESTETPFWQHNDGRVCFERSVRLPPENVQNIK